MSTHDSQLCWACAKAVNKGCSWSARFEPVEGWKAKEVMLNEYPSYQIYECPEFENDGACETCRHKRGKEEHCIGCMYFEESGKRTKVRWEGKHIEISK